MLGEKKFTHAYSKSIEITDLLENKIVTNGEILGFQYDPDISCQLPTQMSSVSRICMAVKNE
jgi:hypothetical protein